MPTRNINLTPQMDKAVAERIKRGQYANASEVVRAGRDVQQKKMNGKMRPGWKPCDSPSPRAKKAPSAMALP